VPDNEAVTKRPSVREIRQVTQPPDIVNRANSEHWLGIPYFRKVSPYLTRWFIYWGWSPNSVTFVMMAVGASAGAALLVPGVVGGMLAALLAQLQMIVDCCDGEVARWTQRYSSVGFFLDKTAHYLAEGFVPVALGLRAAGGLPVAGTDWHWAWYGALLALLVVFNKALNDAVHVARAAAGLPRLTESSQVNAPRQNMLRRMRGLTRYLPFQRAFHSVEMTFFAAIAAFLDRGGLAVTQSLLIAMLVVAAVTVVGHFTAIVSSSRLR
jgi:phosphatidylglycerophosphate synthase